MAKTTAERQAQFRKRKQERLNQCITPEDVRRAVQLVFHHLAAESGDRIGSWEEWQAAQRKKRAGGDWIRFVPESADLEDYDDFSPGDAALLAKVGAVYQAMRFPPDD